MKVGKNQGRKIGDERDEFFVFVSQVRKCSLSADS